MCLDMYEQLLDVHVYMCMLSYLLTDIIRSVYLQAALSRPHVFGFHNYLIAANKHLCHLTGVIHYILTHG